MQNRFLKIMSAFLAVIIFTFSSVSADTYEDINASVSYSVEEGKIVVGATVYGNAVIMVSPYDVDLSSINDSSLPLIMKNVTAYGDFTEGIIMPTYAESKKYRVYVSTSYGEDSADFVYINIPVGNTVIREKVNPESDKERLQSILEDNADDIGIDKADSVFTENKASIANMISKKDYEDVIDFSKTYFSIYPLMAVRNKTPDKTALVLKQHEENLKINYEEDIVKEERLTSSEKDTLFTLLSKYDYEKDYMLSGEVDFKNILKNYKSVAAVQNAGNWVKLKNIITDTFKECFENEIENETYLLVSDKDKVFEIMMRNTYQTPEGIKKGFADAALEQYNIENTPIVTPPVQGGGGSSSGKGGTGGFVAPSETSQPAPDSLKVTFSDVPESFWGFKAIDELASTGVLSGYNDGKFMPSKEITRAEFTKIIISVIEVYEKNLPDAEHEEMAFSDVNENDWFFSSVKKAFENEIIMGFGDNFSPNSFIKREDAALIIYRLMDKLGNTPSGIKAFRDREDISDYAKDAVNSLGSVGVISGGGDNMFFPKNTLTRAEGAQLIYSALIK